MFLSRSDRRPAAGPAAGAFARDFVYSPEMNLLEESTISTFGGNPSPSGGYDYLWFNGHPIAEENGGTHWTFTDHLGTPILQTDGSGTVFWRPEYEPYGRVWALRTTDQHEGPRYPGQEAEELNISGDGNGSSERSYNIFRWYRAKWGRYTQADPVGIITDANAFRYARSTPTGVFDSIGLDAEICCRGFAFTSDPVKHCYIRNGGHTYSLFPEFVGEVLGFPSRDDPRDSLGKGEACKQCSAIPCSPGPGGIGRCLDRATAAYRIRGYDPSGLLFGNSNTYASTLANSCCAGGFPRGMGRVPGARWLPQ